MSEVSLIYLFVFAVSLLLSLLLVPLARWISFKLEILDHPGERKIHAVPIPCLGGIAIYSVCAIVIIGSLLGAYLISKSDLRTMVPDLMSAVPQLKLVLPQLFSLLGGATIILMTGLIDDRMGVRFDWRLKLFIQVFVAIWMTSVGIRVDSVANNTLCILITVLWIVGITNSFNLLDNMDGLSSGVAYICAMLFFFIAARQDQFFMALIFLVLSGSLLGFLYFNFSPASIFLGDTGALFIGFMLATLSVLQSYSTSSATSPFAVLSPIVILSLPLFDTFRVIMIRLYERRSIFQGDRRHLSHRLMEMGMNHRQSVITVYFMTFSLGVGCIILDANNVLLNWIIIAQLFAIIMTITFLMAFAKK